jgi:hypothetical protein
LPYVGKCDGLTFLNIFIWSPTPRTPLSIQRHALKKTHKKLK